MVNNKIYNCKNPPVSRGIFYLWIGAIFVLFGINGLKSQSVIKFTETKKSFGFVNKGEIVTIDFEFQNTGTEPLLLFETKVECSCTSVNFPKQPVPAGQKSVLTVKFDTKNAYDRQDRIVEVISNAKNSPAKIRFKGFVKRK